MTIPTILVAEFSKYFNFGFVAYFKNNCKD